MIANLLKNSLPKISQTEWQALEAGSVWIDGEYFTGNPDFKRILAENYDQLPKEEREFLDGPCQELIEMFDRYEVAETRIIPDDVMQFLKDKGFMALLIPKEYGGLAFSTLGISSVMAKLSPYSAIIGTLVVIPNSLGAAELIKHYGTQEQKDHYLPKLANGDYIPCFGLTEPTAGSDAASIKAEGVVFKDSDGELKLRLNFEKRYITNAPLANLISLACKIVDPDNLLGKGEDLGITVVLLHKGSDGLAIGDHHVPIGEAFYNGPIFGKDVVAPLENVIGGQDYIGLGWKMLMEQLAGGRAVSLPAGAVGGMRSVASVTGPYSMIRQQFGIPIGYMEGIQDKVGKIAGLTYLAEAARVFGCSAVDAGHQPPVTSAILKAYTTDLARELVIDGMDVFSGAGVMQGPNNILGKGYAAAPVGITVEGANIMTRTLIVFGQGATRCHPNALNVVKALEADDNGAVYKNLGAWFGRFFLNIGRSAVRYFTRGITAGSPVSGETATYYRRLGWSASRFAVLTDLAMFTIGGKLKARGNLSGRFADALAWQLLATSALRRWEAEGRKPEDLPLVQYGCDYALAQIQQAFEGIYANFDAPLIGGWLRTVGAFFLRLNPVGRLPSDRTTAACAQAIQALGPQYQRVVGDIARLPEDRPGAGRLIAAFAKLQQAAPVYAKIAKAQKQRKLERGNAEELASLAVEKGVISAEDKALIEAARTARLDAIQVDILTREQFLGLESQFEQAAPAQKMAVNA